MRRFIVSIFILSLVSCGIGFAEDLKPPWDRVKEIAMSVPKNSNGVNLLVVKGITGDTWKVAYDSKEDILAVAETEGQMTVAVFYDRKIDMYIGSMAQGQVVVFEQYITEQEAKVFVLSILDKIKSNKEVIL